MSKKKLDEMFQDKFLDFNQVPDDGVWASIEASLDKKKKKRILPLWWSLGGVAAALLVGFMLFNPFSTGTGTNQIITDVEQQNIEVDEKTNNTLEELKLDNTDVDNIKIVSIKEEESILEAEASSLVTTEAKDNISSGATEKTNPQQGKVIGKDWTKEKEAVVQTQNNNSDPIDKQKNKANKHITNTPLKSDGDIAQTETSFQKKNNAINPSENSNSFEKVIAENELVINNGVATQKNTNVKASENSNTIEKIISDNEETKVTVTQEDNSNPLDKKSIFEELKTQEEEAVVEQSTRRWSAGPSVAPVYFNAMGEGSSVHSIFVPNSKSGNINMSYGLSVGYEISPKLKIRSGIHKVDYGYDTNDVAFSSSLTATTNGQIDNINYRATSKNLVVSSKPGGSALQEAPSNSIDVSAQNAEKDGIMTQQMGYLEIPLELNYALIDKKFGMNLIGGVSSLFLLDNSVALTSGSLTTEMGDANNVNDLNFSANFGLGVNYKFSSNIQLNIEPVFKYQLNTFSETDGTFNPYALGIYSGLSFKF